MTVVCKMVQCPFWDKNGFCGRGVIKIDENGMCNVLWKRGQQRILETPYTEERYPKRLMKIIDAEEDEYYEYEDETIEESKEECGDGTNSEDPLNGTAAKNE